MPTKDARSAKAALKALELKSHLHRAPVPPSLLAAYLELEAIATAALKVEP